MQEKGRLNGERSESFPNLCEQKGAQEDSRLFHKEAEERLFGLQVNSKYIPTICTPLRK